MYNPEKLEEYAKKIYSRYEYFNDYTLQTIARRIKAIGQLSAHDQKALKNIADITGDMDLITKKLAKLTQMSVSDIEKIYTQVVTDGVNTYKPIYDYKGMKFVPFAENDYAMSIVKHWAKQTAGEMLNLSRTKAIGFDKCDAFGNVIGHTPLEGAYEQAISEAVQALAGSTTDFNTAMSRTVERLGGSGVKVTYGSGVNRSLSAMIRQNLLYGAKQAAQAYDEHVSEELELDGVEIDAHAGCRPTHLIMQGKFYAIGDKSVIVDGKKYRGIDEDIGAEDQNGTGSVQGLLNDYGCLHFKTGVLLGVSEPRYTDEELAEIKRKSTELIEYDGRKKTLYEWKQTQRSFERAIRGYCKKADMFKAAGMKHKADVFNEKAAAYHKKYDNMCGKIKGLSPRYERMRVYKTDSIKTVDNSAKSDIIKLGSGEMYRKAKENYIEPMPKKQLHKIEKCFKKQGGIIQRSSEIDSYLQEKNAEAITYDAHTILLKSNPGRASVFEELIHATQYKNGENDGSYISRLMCEISAQEKLLTHQKAYKLTEKEIIQTTEALKTYKEELNKRKGGI